MEDVLAVYRRPYDPARPVVCLDETFKQLIGETREPLPMRPGAVERFDHVYVRNGTASLFLACEPLAAANAEFVHVYGDRGSRQAGWSCWNSAGVSVFIERAWICSRMRSPRAR